MPCLLLLIAVLRPGVAGLYPDAKPNSAEHTDKLCLAANMQYLFFASAWAGYVYVANVDAVMCICGP